MRVEIMIKYSFLVPVYNVKDYLKKCVDSILNQNYPVGSYEIILVDDGSTDGSEEICDEYSDKYSNIKVIHQDNNGLLLARGTGVRESSGEYLLFIDSDDYVENNLLTVVDSYIREFTPECLCFSYYIERPNKASSHSVTSKEYELLNAEEMFVQFAPSDKYNTIWNKVVKGDLFRQHIDEIYSIRTNIGEDKVQTAFLLKYANSILLVRDCLYHYVIRNTSIAHYKTEEDIHNIIAVYNKLDDVMLDDIKILSISEDQGVDLYSAYKANALNSVMDHIFKLNSRTDISRSMKCGSLDNIVRQERNFFMDGRNYCKALKIYNKYRYRMLIGGRFGLLVTIDRYMCGLKSVISK